MNLEGPGTFGTSISAFRTHLRCALSVEGVHVTYEPRTNRRHLVPPTRRPCGLDRQRQRRGNRRSKDQARSVAQWKANAMKPLDWSDVVLSLSDGSIPNALNTRSTTRLSVTLPDTMGLAYMPIEGPDDLPGHRFDRFDRVLPNPQRSTRGQEGAGTTPGSIPTDRPSPMAVAPHQVVSGSHWSARPTAGRGPSCQSSHISLTEGLFLREGLCQELFKLRWDLPLVVPSVVRGEVR